MKCDYLIYLRFIFKLMTKLNILFSTIFCMFILCASAQNRIVINSLNSPVNSTFRAINAVNDSTVWVSGSRGVVMRSCNYGKDWDVFYPDTLKKNDFRSLHAWGKDTAIVFTAGSPALCYKTVNGGKDWKKTYSMNYPNVFVNSMHFKDANNGVVWGDPMNGKFFMLQTTDGGDSWSELDAPISLDGDGGFAASNSCVQYLPSGKIVFITGVGRSYFYWTDSDKDIDWSLSNTGIISGGDSKADGIYCVYMIDENRGIAAGGNYTLVNDNKNIVSVTNDGGASWILAESLPHGFISDIAPILDDNASFIAVGSHGSSITHDMGLNWVKNGDDGYHAVSASKNGKYIYFAGERGKLGVLKN